MNQRIHLLAVVIVAITATTAQAQNELVAIGTDTSIGNGVVITARVTGASLSTLGTSGGSGADIADVGWRSDLTVATLTDANGQFGLLNTNASTAVGNNGLGEPGRTLSVYNSGPCPDCVFFGTFDNNPGVANTQVRAPSFGPIATPGGEGINGGPGQFGDGAIKDSVQQPDGDLVFIYESGAQDRIRRQLNGDLASGGGDEGTGGLSAVDTQLLIDRLVVARTDDIIELRRGDNLSPDLGGFTVTAGPFAAPIVDIGVLGNDNVVVAAGNELQVRAAGNLASLAGTGGAAGVTGTITALAVSPVTNNIFIGTDEGNVRVFNSSLVEIVPLTNYGSGSITALSVTVPEPTTGALLLLASMGLVGVRRRS